jgi:hypothetical protein
MPVCGGEYLEGRLRLQEVSPWKIEILEGFEGYEGEDDLDFPILTPEKWDCKGQLPGDELRGLELEFWGYIPNDGGGGWFSVEFDHGESSYQFTSKYIVPSILEGTENKDSGIARGFLTWTNGALLLAIGIAVASFVRVRRGGQGAPSP